LTCLALLDVLTRKAQPLSALARVMQAFPQILVNVRVADKGALAGNAAVQQAIQEAADMIGPRGRIFVRPSGTEPVIRVMGEGQDERWFNGRSTGWSRRSGRSWAMAEFWYGPLGVVTGAEMAALDREAIDEYRVPQAALMERAGYEVAQAVARFAGGSAAGVRVHVICGSGNNGGDGLVAARALANLGARVRVFPHGFS